jgi:hypothetical protein
LSGYRPVTPESLAGELAERIAARGGPVRVAIDGPPCAPGHALAEALVAPLRLLSRPCHLVRAEGFWRDASLRLEHGREDPDSYLGWLDDRALNREVLTPAVEQGRYLPSLRDPATDRSTHDQPRPIGPEAVLVVSGPLLLGLGLPFDYAVHLAVSAPARERRTPADQAWTLPAFDRYDAEVHPAALADAVVRWDDPRRPAVRFAEDVSSANGSKS